MQERQTDLLLVELSQKKGYEDDKTAFAQNVEAGLSKSVKSLSSRYFYDSVGSKLFQQIMELPEYYLTRCEYEVLSENKEAIAQHFGDGGFFHLIDLGAGDALKTKILLRELSEQGRQFDYVPVDISGDAMEQLTQNLLAELPTVAVHAVIGEYFQALKWLQENKSERKVVLFLGSNIGNFNPEESENFLQSIRGYLQAGDKFLLGVDLRKDPEKLIPAYSDASGVTAAFNLNLLHRINQELGGDFDISGFRHYALYEPQEGAMKSYLISERPQEVFIKEIEKTFRFEAWEAIQTENSFKYTINQVKELGATCGFRLEEVFIEKEGCFADVLFTVE